MSDFQNELDQIRKIRQVKFEKCNSIVSKSSTKPTYNYDLRKDTISYIKKTTNSEVLRERMDKIEKIEYKNKIAQIYMEDLDYFSVQELNTNFMIELFKYCSNLNILEKAYLKYNNVPHILMIKELLTKPNVTQDLVIKLVSDYTESNKNIIPIITTTNLLTTKFTNAINLIMEIFYSNTNTYPISFEQLRLIYSSTIVNPDQLEFLIKRCSNINGYSKCQKTFIERSNRDLIKNIIHEVESKYKTKVNVDLYN